FPADFLALPSSCNPTAPSVAPLAIRSTRKNADLNATALVCGTLREQCQEHPSTKRPRRVSAVFWPVSPDPLSPPPLPASPSLPPLPSSASLLWRDWPRCSLRRRWLALIRRE